MSRQKFLHKMFLRFYFFYKLIKPNFIFLYLYSLCFTISLKNVKWLYVYNRVYFLKKSALILPGIREHRKKKKSSRVSRMCYYKVPEVIVEILVYLQGLTNCHWKSLLPSAAKRNQTGKCFTIKLCKIIRWISSSSYTGRWGKYILIAKAWIMQCKTPLSMVIRQQAIVNLE